MLKRVSALFLIQVACACASYKKPLPALAPAQAASAPQVFKFSDKARQTRLATIVFDLPMGHRYGEAAAGYDGHCMRKEPLVNTKGRFQYDVSKYADLFTSVMKSHGYPVDDEVELFENSKEHVADLKIGARITDATLNVCYPESYKNDLKATGSAYLKVEWSIYSTLEKKVVLVSRSEGSTYTDVESTIGEAGILRPALADALEKLAVDAKYRQIVDPPASMTELAKATAGRIKIKHVKEFSGDLKSHIDLIKAAVATITANRGTGSGFVISGLRWAVAILSIGFSLTIVAAVHLYPLTPVAGLLCLAVIFSGAFLGWRGSLAAAIGESALLIALVHLDCKGLMALPVSRQKIVEGNEVFAIGTPLSEKLQFSVTKGVVSGIRKIDELDYIQSDVSVHPGSSGGPLLDSKGNAVGVTSLGSAAGSVPVGLNFFIPLADIDKYVPVEFE